MSKTLLIGIDAHSKSNTACFMDKEGEIIEKAYRFQNNFPCAQIFEDKIVAAMITGQFLSIKIATESTSLYHTHLIDFLAASDKLRQFEVEIIVFNPKTTTAFKKAYPDKDKTDSVDAFVIADRLRFGRLPEPYASNQNYLPLRRLTRYRCHLAESIAREKQYFLLHLFLKYSSYSSLKPFSNTFGNTSVSFILEDFFIDELAEKPLEELVEYVSKHGKNGFADPTAVAEALKQIARESYRIRPALASSVNLILTSTLANIRALEKSIKQVNNAIEEELKAFPNTLDSVPGLGPVMSAGIFAEIGNINKFPSHNALAKFAGLTWRQNSSGDFAAEITRMTKTGNQYLRYYLIEAANLLRMHNKEYSDYYSKKLLEVTKHRHKRALALTARKLVRLLFFLLKNNKLYQHSSGKVGVQ